MSCSFFWGGGANEAKLTGFGGALFGASPGGNPGGCPRGPRFGVFRDAIALGGGAIIAARGSLDTGVGAGVGFEGPIEVGGGGIGLTFSAGSSPGKTQTFLSSS